MSDPTQNSTMNQVLADSSNTHSAECDDTPAYDPEVLGGDTCDLGQCCLNPCGYLLEQLRPCFQRQFRRESRIADFLFDRSAQEILYVAICYGGWAVIFLNAYPLIQESQTVENFHMNIGYALFVVCLLSWRVASETCPGNITEKTLAKFDNYPYDNVLYTNTICPTLNIRKLPRSKYNRYSDTHVPRFDHHCHVLNQSVGEENYRYFLLFLAVHVAMVNYGAFILCRLLWGEVQRSRHPEHMVLIASRLSITNVLQRLIAFAFVNMALTSLLWIMVAASIMLAGFLAFHCYIISVGMTTNEFYKWKDQSKKHRESVQKYHKEATAISSLADMTGGGKRDEEAALVIGSVDHPGQMASNLYDLGIYANIQDVFYPRSMLPHQKTC